MIRNLKFLLILLFFIILNVNGQTNNLIDPVWSISFGNKEHTSRDELFKMIFDKDSNLIVIGSVERDSSFCDVLVQKYSRKGDKLWQHRFTSGKYLD